MQRVMNNEQIFYKAVEKAALSGFNELDPHAIWVPMAGVIFSQDFAKAFWGERLFGTNDFTNWAILSGESHNELDAAAQNPDYWRITLPEWKLRLQQMVLENEPLKYIEKYL